ncbi:hypothetical protein ACM26V_03510 [Salipaludibacillus sp. HK11]|uniref:hypothetical protein n=1 Tax=Salipaludibacillus sp. HK11 TaxID=3394320 RepID=UPI0039FD3694
MNQITLILFALTAGIVLSACGDNEESTQLDTEQEEQEATKMSEENSSTPENSETASHEQANNSENDTEEEMPPPVPLDTTPVDIEDEDLIGEELTREDDAIHFLTADRSFRSVELVHYAEEADTMALITESEIWVYSGDELIFNRRNLYSYDPKVAISKDGRFVAWTDGRTLQFVNTQSGEALEIQDTENDRIVREFDSVGFRIVQIDDQYILHTGILSTESERNPREAIDLEALEFYSKEYEHDEFLDKLTYEGLFLEGGREMYDSFYDDYHVSSSPKLTYLIGYTHDDHEYHVVNLETGEKVSINYEEAGMNILDRRHTSLITDDGILVIPHFIDEAGARKIIELYKYDMTENEPAGEKIFRSETGRASKSWWIHLNPEQSHVAISMGDGKLKYIPLEDN